MRDFSALKCEQIARCNNREKWSKLYTEVSKCRKNFERILTKRIKLNTFIRTYRTCGLKHVANKFL